MVEHLQMCSKGLTPMVKLVTAAPSTLQLSISPTSRISTWTNGDGHTCSTLSTYQQLPPTSGATTLTETRATYWSHPVSRPLPPLSTQSGRRFWLHTLENEYARDTSDQIFLDKKH